MNKKLVKTYFLWLVIVIYGLLMLSIIKWGIPGFSHPFNYHMDEWHQMQAVRDLFKYGTNNMEGAAHGPVLQFLIGGLFLAPFTLLNIIDPFSVGSSLENLVMQEKIFTLLRINTLIFGILSVIVLWKIIKNNFKINPIPPVILFVFCPMWLALSNYFKYDIALIFWILLFIYSVLEFSKKPILKKFILSSVVAGLCLSAKASAIPVFFILIFSFFIFTPSSRRKIKNLFYGIIAFLITFIILGIPDLIFLQRGDYMSYMFDNLVTSPQTVSTYSFGMPWFIYILVVHYPLIFGLVLYLLSIISFLFISYHLILKRIKEKRIIFIYSSFVIFALSLIVLKIDLRGNRSLVLLPFLVLMISYLLENIKLRKAYFLIFILVFIQVLQSLPFVLYKTTPDPKQISSLWIKQNIGKESLIGLQNVPIYQGVPDLILKDYYSYQAKKESLFKYKIIDSKIKELPSTIVLTNTNFYSEFISSKEEKMLLDRLEKENYKLSYKIDPEIKYFFTDFNNLNFSGMLPLSNISIYKK